MVTALKDSQVSVRLPNDLRQKMEAYAHLTGRTKSYVAIEALSVYLEERIPQIEDLKAAVLAADQGQFATDAEVGAVVTRYAGPRAARATRKPAAARRAK